MPAIIVDKMTEFSLDEAESKRPTANVGETSKQEPKPAQDKPKCLWLNVSSMDDEDIEELLETLSYYEGDTQVYFVRDGKKMFCSQKVVLNKGLMAELATFLPENCIKIS